jgi:serine/threonine protein kinase
LARFEREIKLTTDLQHPNVIRALASGTLKVGAYSLPFYTMPLAPKTLRELVKPWQNADDLSSLFRLFLKAARGVVFLHSHGIVHRDLKPGNILVTRDGNPWVADLRIAHVNPRFASGSLETIEKERLLNRDYYAPEQRFGSAKDVDHRADVYALGCILYELLVTIPPVRNDSPSLGTRDPALSSLDPILDRMMAYSADDRYQSLEDALDDLSIQFGWVLATFKGERPLPNRDLPSMVKLLRSSNEAHRRRGIEFAAELGKGALQSLHELLGHGRRDVRNAAALALGEIGDPGSLQYLTAALYGNSNKASTFRPTTDAASLAIQQYPKESRLKVCSDITQPVKPWQILQILKGLPSEEAFAAVSRLVARKLVLLDWAESEVDTLVEIDEEKAWPIVLQMIERGENWKIRSVIGKLTPSRQVECITRWLHVLKDRWFFEQILTTLHDSPAAAELRREALKLLRRSVAQFSGRYDEKLQVIQRIDLDLGVLDADWKT